MKTPINLTVKTPRCKDDANKDPYPWLDDNNPRRNMTDKEILENTIDLPEACITEKQKQALCKILVNTEKLSHIGMKFGYVQIWK